MSATRLTIFKIVSTQKKCVRLQCILKKKQEDMLMYHI